MVCCWLLVVILLTDEMAEPYLLWDQFKAGLCDDVKHKLYHINHYQADQEILLGNHSEVISLKLMDSSGS